MLGDASLQTQNKGLTYRMKFEWSDKNKTYLNHLFEVYNEWILSDPHKKVRISPWSTTIINNNNKIINWGFQTISHEAFKFLADLFIMNNKKSISKNLICNTARGLAYWFMDDGGKLDYNLNSKNKSIVLNTHSFTELEVKSMTEELGAKFKLKCYNRKNKGKDIIIICSDSLPDFYSLIKPYILEEMKNKLPKFE